MTTLGTRIKTARGLKNLTQEALAVHVGVARATLASWEIDRASPGAQELARLSEVLAVTVDYLVKGPGDSEEEGPLDWPEGVKFLRRASEKLTDDMKRKMIRAMEQFLEEDKPDPKDQ